MDAANWAAWQFLSLYALVALASGLFAGLLGIGGGIIIVPALLYLFKLQHFPEAALMHMAVATSLTTIIFTSLSAGYAQHRRGALLRGQVLPLLPGIAVGALAGGVIAGQLSSHALRMLFGVFECCMAWYIGRDVHVAPHRTLPGGVALAIAGGVISALATVLGIGGGVLVIPFLLWCNVGVRNAVAASSVSGFPIALLGTITMVYSGWGGHGLPAGTFGYVYWPAALVISLVSIVAAPQGVRLAHALPVGILRRILALLLAVIGIRMLL
jgi:hypothetical protein